VIDEMVDTVRAALTPGADPATRQRAAAILRGLLTMLEGGTAAAGAQETSPATGGKVEAPPVPQATDWFGAFIDQLRPFLPAEALPNPPAFRVPMIRVDD
jgi:hypothetical protein